MNKENIGDFIKEKRHKQNLTQQELANKLCITRENLSKWERGLSIPNTEYLLPLSEILDVPVVDLISGKENDKNEAEEVIVNIIDKSNKNKKMFIKILFIVIISSLLLFLSYYFISNYNRVKVYSIDVDEKGYIINESLLVIFKDKVYFVFNGIENQNDDDITDICIYYYKNDNKIIIYQGKELPHYTKIEIDEKVDTLLDNTYIDIITDSNTETLKLDYKKLDSNNKLKDEKKESNDRSDSFFFENVEIPNLQSFNYDESTNMYSYNYANFNIEYYELTKTLTINYINDNEYEILSFYGKNQKRIFYNRPEKNDCDFTYQDTEILSSNCDNYIEQVKIILKKYNDFLANIG